jgi:L-lactate dehydrogenase (cytochrome)
MSSLAAWTNEQFDPRLSWPDVEWVKKQWGGKLILKGIMDVEDANWPWPAAPTPSSSATTAGASSTARPPASRAARHRRGVGDKIEVWMDGGIRSGQDVLKAWALGARGTMTSAAAMVYGLGAMGEGRRHQGPANHPQGAGRHDGVLRPHLDEPAAWLGGPPS